MAGVQHGVKPTWAGQGLPSKALKISGSASLVSGDVDSSCPKVFPVLWRDRLSLSYLNTLCHSFDADLANRSEISSLFRGIWHTRNLHGWREREDTVEKVLKLASNL